MPANRPEERDRVTKWIPLVVPVVAVVLAVVTYFIFSSVVIPVGA
jgi:flagellar basal body-associated protein FliL